MFKPFQPKDSSGTVLADICHHVGLVLCMVQEFTQIVFAVPVVAIASLGRFFKIG